MIEGKLQSETADNLGLEGTLTVGCFLVDWNGEKLQEKTCIWYNEGQSRTKKEF